MKSRSQTLLFFSLSLLLSLVILSGCGDETTTDKTPEEDPQTEQPATAAEKYYKDSDGDGYGDAATIKESTTPPTGFVTNKDDCNDSDATVHPSATEICDGVDQDCDSQADNGITIYRVGNGHKYATIQSAIDVANDSQCVEVDSGIYDEDIDFSGKNITVRALYGQEFTTIQGNGTSTRGAVTFSNGENSHARLDGFVINTNGSERGIYILNSSPTIVNNTITENLANESNNENGGGIYISANNTDEIAAPLIEANVITNNSAYSGAGIYADATSNGTLSAIIRNNTITGNTTGATSSESGGGIFVRAYTNGQGTPLIEKNKISSNSAYYYGDGIMIQGLADNTMIPTLRNNLIQENGDTGIYVWAPTGSMSGIITNNIIIGHKRGLNIECTGECSIGYGSQRLNITNNTIIGNTDYGIFVYTEVANTIHSDIQNNIITGSTTGLSLFSTTEDITYSYVSITTNDVTAGTTKCLGTTACDDGNSFGNIFSDPLFADDYTGAGDGFNFSLTADSPCINTGNASAEFNDPDGSRNDMGAFGGPFGSNF